MNAVTAPQGRVQLVNFRMRSLDTARMRVLWVALIFAAVALGALARIGFLGLGGGPARATSLEEALLPPRGEITDRNGTPLARAFPAYALWYNPKALGDEGPPLVGDPREVAQKLAAIFPEMDAEQTA